MLSGALALALSLTAGASAEPVPRPTPYAGAVIATKGGEELQFRADALWRYVEPAQNLVGGDTIRTNALGNVAILFEDRTQVRVGRNSTLVVKDIARGPNGETLLALPNGSIYARASRGGAGVKIETPAAAAAIRGTDWSLSVDGPKTALIVLEGEVVLANPQGSVTVRQGEGAEALIGQAPRKITLVNFNAREQILIYRELRDSYQELTPTDLTRREEREARGRALARPEPARSADDWLTLAETGHTYDGRAAAARALSEARKRPLGARQEARARLIACFLDAQAQRWREAAAECKAAIPALDARRKPTADYLAWVALAMANPNSRPAPPPPGRYADQPSAILARASIESFVDGARKGIDILEQNERRFPDDVTMRAGKALLYIMLGDEKAAKRAIEEARAIDPDDPFMLVASARYRYTVQSDLEGALKELDRAKEIAPGSDFVWAELSLVQADREADREAEAAHLKSIELDPDSPLNHTNYANFLIDESRLPEAERALERAEKIDPSGYPSIVTRGRLLVRQGRLKDGTDKLLAASAVNPAYAGGLLEIAIANYQAGNLDETNQALDNADRFDDDNPTIPLIRSVIAVDQYKADEAIVNAREALRRRLARGGDYATIDANRQNGSFFASALRFLELDEWGRYYGDRVANAFEATSYFDKAITERVNPFMAATSAVPPDEASSAGANATSFLLQGLLLEPLAIAGSERRTSLAYHPFFEAAAEGGVSIRDGRTGWLSDATVQGNVMEPFPVSVYANLAVRRPDSPFPNDADDNLTGVAFVGAKPTATDNVVMFTVAADQKTGARLFDADFPLARRNDEKTFVSSTGVAWSHEIGERNLMQAMAVGTFLDQTTHRVDPGDDRGVNTRQRIEQRDVVAGLSHLIGIGDVTLRYGAEGALAKLDFRQRSETVVGEPLVNLREKPDGEGWRVYADAVWDITRNLKLEFAAVGNRTEIGGLGETRFDPRAGVAWQPLDGHWLRAAYRKDTFFTSPYTLAPLTTVGIQPNDLPLTFGGRTETIAARWDAEWTRHLFTALDFQSQDVRGLSIDVPETVHSAEVARSRVDRVSASANIWLGHGLGAFGSYARTWSEALSEDALGLSTDGFTYAIRRGGPLPFLAKHSGRVGLSYVHPSKVKLTVAQNFVGERIDSVTTQLDGFTTTDLSAQWESPDKRLLISGQLLNVFDREYDVMLTIPGQGRTLTASARLRW